VWVSASSIAVSVLGRIGTQTALAAAGPSSRTGLTLTTSIPARASAVIQPPTECSPQPPFATCMFFGLAPPNSTTSLPWRAIDDHEVSGPLTACAEPMTCGRNFSAVPKL
jgi:hypothetical protein